MGEISLICPGCGAEYRVPQSAIPAEGREVECSGCGHVWHALAGTAPRPEAPAAILTPEREDEDADEPPAPAIPLRERLPENVLNILRDEVEHERRARAAETVRQAGGTGDVEWPATTVTGPAMPDEEQAPVLAPALALARRSVSPPAAVPAPRPMAEEAPAEVVPLTARLPDPAPMPAATGEPVPAAPADDSRAGYAMGFGFAVMVAVGLFALYQMAPSMTGPFGDVVNGLRESVDRGRLWLHG